MSSIHIVRNVPANLLPSSLIGRRFFFMEGQCKVTTPYTVEPGVRSHAPSIRSHIGRKVVGPDIQPMRVPEEPVCIELFRQNPVFTSLNLKCPVHVVGKNVPVRTRGSQAQNRRITMTSSSSFFYSVGEGVSRNCKVNLRRISAVRVSFSSKVRVRVAQCLGGAWRIVAQ